MHRVCLRIAYVRCDCAQTHQYMACVTGTTSVTDYMTALHWATMMQTSELGHNSPVFQARTSESHNRHSFVTFCEVQSRFKQISDIDGNGPKASTHVCDCCHRLCYTRELCEASMKKISKRAKPSLQQNYGRPIGEQPT